MIKKLQPEEKEKFIDFLLSLSRNTLKLWTKFGNIKNRRMAERIANELVNMSEDDSTNFIYLKNKEIVSYAYLKYFPNKPFKKFNAIFGLVVRDEYQKKGIGRKMLEYAVRYAKNIGKRKIWLTVYLDNVRAIRLYKNAGFESEGVFINDEYINNRPRHIVSMALFLDKVKNYAETRKEIFKDLETI